MPKNDSIKTSTGDICMMCGGQLNDDGECQVCIDTFEEDNSLEEYDDIKETGEEYDY